jgi:hypothetical protein
MMSGASMRGRWVCNTRRVRSGAFLVARQRPLGAGASARRPAGPGDPAGVYALACTSQSGRRPAVRQRYPPANRRSG